MARDWRLGFITGIFHAIDPIDVAQYSRSEYEGYAKMFIAWVQKVSVGPTPSEEQILAWLLDQDEIILVSAQKMRELAKALSRS